MKNIISSQFCHVILIFKTKPPSGNRIYGLLGCDVIESRKLEALSIVRSTCLKISLKMDIQIGTKLVAVIV